MNGHYTTNGESGVYAPPHSTPAVQGRDSRYAVSAEKTSLPWRLTAATSPPSAVSA